MKILISGAGGFIGSNLVRHLQKRHEIHALDICPRPQFCDATVQWIQTDLTRDDFTAELPTEMDAILHLAQSRHYREFPDKARDIYQVNVNSCFQLLEYGRKAGIQHFVFTSTGGVYRNSNEDLQEDSLLQPSNFYAVSKYTAELLTNSYAACFIPIIFRLFFVYGPGQKGMLVPGLLEKVLNNETINIDGNPGLKINPTYVGDVVRAFEPALMLDHPETINIAGDEKVTITDLALQMERICNKKAHIEYRAVSSGRLTANNRKMKELLQIIPQTELAVGLKRMVDFYNAG